MELPEGVPENVQSVVRDHGIFVPTEGISDEAMVVYTRMLEGECMHCASRVEEQVTAILNHLGVVMLFCSQVCLQDFFNLHWMMEQYDDLVDSAKFRNAASKGDHDG